MGLSLNYRKRLKESMDRKEGGSLHAIADKAAAVDAPVLIIGLGGSGMDSLLVTKKKIYDIIQREKLSEGTYADKPQNIEYLGIDTDQSDKGRSYQGIRLNENAGEIQIYSMPNVQQVLNNPEMMPEYISRWLDTSMTNETVIDGAGAVRQLGRLLLMQNIGRLIPILEEKIKKVTVGYDDATPLYVFIIAGISGGTGSGMFLDMPYLVDAVASAQSARPIRKIGLFLLPDVNANRDGISAVGRSSLYANGFAALKELDYLMNIEKVGDVFEQNYGAYQVGRKSGGGALKPYDICLLLSAKGKDGALAATGNEGYDMVTQIVAETIFNFVLGDTGKTDFADFSINSWISNEDKNMGIYRSLLGDLRHPVSYVYSIAGASSAKLPMDELMSYLAYRMAQQVQDFWNREPEEADIDLVEKYFHLSKNTIASEARAAVAPVNTSQIDAKAAINSHAQVVQLYEEMLKKQKKTVKNNLDEMQGRLKELLDDRNNILNQYFTDIEKGPVFASRCLESGGRSVITDLRLFKQEFTASRPEEKTIAALTQQVGMAQEDLRKALIKRGKLETYLQKMNQLYQAKLNQYINDQLVLFCANADNLLSAKEKEIYEVLADLLRQLMPIFEDYGKIRTNTEKEEDDPVSRLSWAIVDTPKFIKDLEKRMEGNQEFTVNLEEVVRNFYTYLLENVDKWYDENQDAVEDLNTFIYRQFDRVLDNSMDFFLGLIAESENKTLNQYCTDIIRELSQQADVRYPINASFASSAVPQPAYSFISIPDNAPELYKAAVNAVNASALQDGAKSIVKQSGVRDRIFMMTFMSATPLSLNADIKQFYSTYMQHRDSQKGLHLYVPTRVGKRVSDTDWRDLPSPYPESEWTDFFDPKEHEINEKYREILRKAIAYGYVQEDTLHETMTLYWGELPDWEKIAKEHGIDLAGEAPIRPGVAAAFLSSVEEQLTKEAIRARCSQSVVREDMVKDVDGTLKDSYKEILFIQMYRPRREIARMVENHEEALSAMEKVNARVMDNDLAESYVQCRVTGQLTEHPKKLGGFIYFDRRKVAQDLVTLSSQQMKFREYYLFNSFRNLPKEVRKSLKEVSTGIIEENREKMAEAVKKYRELLIEDQLEELNLNHGSIRDGEKILDGYQILKEVSEDAEAAYKPTKINFGL